MRTDPLNLDAYPSNLVEGIYGVFGSLLIPELRDAARRGRTDVTPVLSHRDYHVGVAAETNGAKPTSVAVQRYHFIFTTGGNDATGDWVCLDTHADHQNLSGNHNTLRSYVDAPMPAILAELRQMKIDYCGAPADINQVLSEGHLNVMSSGDAVSINRMLNPKRAERIDLWNAATSRLPFLQIEPVR
jgi:hypothetical protein